jgi:cobalt/nickel transport protein
MKNKKVMNLVLISIAVMIAVMPLIIIKGSEFGGADGKAEDVVKESSPGYEPWIDSFWSPPGGETESLLFALQAAIGAGVVCMVIGYYKGRRDGRRLSVSDR